MSGPRDNHECRRTAAGKGCMLTAEDHAAIKANADEWVKTPLPDHVVLEIRKIWNSVR